MMTDNAYAVAFRIGGTVSAILLLVAALSRPLRTAALFALAAWVLVTLFVLPWLYVCTANKELRFPPWWLRGPHR